MIFMEMAKTVAGLFGSLIRTDPKRLDFAAGVANLSIGVAHAARLLGMPLYELCVALMCPGRTLLARL
jgi:hypothetical protein